MHYEIVSGRRTVTALFTETNAPLRWAVLISKRQVGLPTEPLGNPVEKPWVSGLPYSRKSAFLGCRIFKQNLFDIGLIQLRNKGKLERIAAPIDRQVACSRRSLPSVCR
jgi:hypothetical protein